MSDSDESLVIPVKRKKKYKIEDSEDCSSCDSSPVLRTSAKRFKKQLSESSSDTESDVSIMNSKKGPKVLQTESEGSSGESEWESDWSSDNTEDLIQKTLEESNQAAISSSEDENSEKCPICLLKLSKQEVATPENCAHTFCFECLQEWSKNVSTCPIDRKEFNVMIVRKRYLSSHKREVKVAKIEKPPEEDDPTYCEICRNSDREETMLLCDGCDCGFHMDCLTPRLLEIPSGDWFCPSCSELNNSAVLNTNTDRTDGRLIPRTTHSERVRHNVERERTRQYTFIDIFDPDQPSTSSGFIPNERPRIESPKKLSKTSKRKSTIKKRTTRRKRRKVSKRKYVTEYEICQNTGAKIPVRKLVPAKKRSARSTKRKTKRKVKGKTKNRKTTSTSHQKYSGNKILDKKESEGIKSTATLDLFGQRNELNYFSDESDFEEPMSSKASLINRINLSKKTRIITPATSSPNLLDSIMASQEQWHSKSSRFQMQSDGKILIKNKHGS